MTELHIIPHTHWDKEWYFTQARARMYALADFDEVLDTLEKDERFACFHLDGQTSIIEEYLAWHPHQKERLKALVKANRLIIGPWYTQSDTLIAGGESLIHNLRLGIRQSKKLGGYQSIGYLPDSFGMSGNMPQLYRQFGLHYALFRRGTARHLLNNREFIWEGVDGSQIFTHHLYHYGSMAYPPNNPDDLAAYFEKMVEQLKATGASPIILLFNGEDQKPIRKNLPDLVRIGMEKTGYPIKIARLEEAMTELEHFYQQHPEALPTVKGEFTFGQDSRTHKSIFSTRADLKQMSSHLEQFVTNFLQPMSALAYSLGEDYESYAIEEIWKKILLNAAHDSMGNCNSDATNEDIRARYVEAGHIATELFDFKCRQISQRVKEKDVNQFQVYNFLPYERSGRVEAEIYSPYQNFEVVDASTGGVLSIEVLEQADVTDSYLKKSLREIGVDNAENAQWPTIVKRLYKTTLLIEVKDLPAFGYQTFYLKERQETRESSHSVEEKSIENELLKVTFDKGQVHLTVKVTGQIIPNFLQLLDDGDEGDAYDYSEPTRDWPIWGQLLFDCVIVGSLEKKLVLKGEFQAPWNLKERQERKISTWQDLRLTLTLTADSDEVKVRVETANQLEEHRMRLVVNTGRKNDSSLADVQFGTIQRPVYLEQVERWKEEGWDEKPRTIEPFMSYVANGCQKGDLQVIAQEVKEYQFIGENYEQVALTLYRSTPYLGKKDLNDRPGRESGTLAETKGTQFKNRSFDMIYVIRPLLEDENETSLAQAAKAVLTSLVAYQAAPYCNNTDNFVLSQAAERDLPLNVSLFNLDKSQVLSTVEKASQEKAGAKESETDRRGDKAGDKKEMIVRAFNPLISEKVEAKVPSGERISAVRSVNLLVESLDQTDLAPCGLVNWAIRL